jgi:hypothetical protein
MPRPFVRVYHEDLMRDYPAVYSDDQALALWLRLLVIADKMWPSLPELPRSARGRGMVLLTQAKLVTLVPPNYYRIRGYESERQSRQDAARIGAAKRWHGKGNADAYADALLHARAPRPSTSTRPESESLSEKEREKRARAMPQKVGEILGRVIA